MDQQTFHQWSYMYTIGEKFTYTGTVIFIYQNLNSYRMVMNGNCIISLFTAFICCLLTIIKCTHNDFNEHVNTLIIFILSGLNILQRLCQLLQLWIWYFVLPGKKRWIRFYKAYAWLVLKMSILYLQKDTNLEMELIIKEVSLEETWTI